MYNKERPTGDHWRAEAADWGVAKVDGIQLMLCIQTRAQKAFDEHEADAEGTDYSPPLRVAMPASGMKRIPPV